jgi:hypothetical protein
MQEVYIVMYDNNEIYAEDRIIAVDSVFLDKQLAEEYAANKTKADEETYKDYPFINTKYYVMTRIIKTDSSLNTPVVEPDWDALNDYEEEKLKSNIVCPEPDEPDYDNMAKDLEDKMSFEQENYPD